MHARHYATGESIELTVTDGRIASIRPSAELPTAWVAPAFFDPQINGCLGVSFNAPTLTADGIRTVVAECRRHGVGGFCPTLITASFDALRHGFATLAAARDADPALARVIPGYHLEGPYLSGEDGPRGAHPREHARDPDWDEFRRLQDAAAGRILMVTVAPERAGAIRFIEQLSAAGVVVAIGHTAATAAQLREAVEAGARTSTHLGNGAHAVLPRHPNYLWDQLADDRLWMSLIPDGHHLPPAVVKCLVRAKGVARTLVTCDASSLAGMPPGRYHEWGTELEVLPSGKVVLADTPYLAGSGHFTDRCVGTLIRDAGVTLAEAAEMASVRPRELLGLPVPRLDVGDVAELVVFDWEPGGDVRVREVL